MIFIITRTFKIRAKNKNEALDWLNEATRDGRQQFYLVAESVAAKREKKEPTGLLRELLRQLLCILFGTKRR